MVVEALLEHVVKDNKSGNKPLCAIYRNFNLDRMILIQEGWSGKVGGVIRIYSMIRDTFANYHSHVLVLLQTTTFPEHPLNQHRVAQIEVYIVYTE